jgi:hypothetical protein
MPKCKLCNVEVAEGWQHLCGARVYESCPDCADLQSQLRQAKAELDAARGAVEMLYAAAERHAIKRGLDDDHPLREAISHPTVQAARAK